MMEIITCEIVDSLPDTDIHSSTVGNVKTWPVPIQPQFKIGPVYCTIKAGIHTFIGHTSKISSSMSREIILDLKA